MNHYYAGYVWLDSHTVVFDRASMKSALQATVWNLVVQQIIGTWEICW